MESLEEIEIQIQIKKWWCFSYYKLNQSFKVSQYLDNEYNFEYICLKVSQLNTKHFFLLTVYKSPSENQINFQTQFENLISVIENNEIISIGDFNTEYNIKQEKFEDKNWGKTIRLLDMKQLISDYTRVNRFSATCIDHIYSNKTNNIAISGVLNASFSDHNPTFTIRKLNFNTKRRVHQEILYTFRNWKKFNKEKFEQHLQCIPFGYFLENKNFENATVFYTFTIQTLIEL
jgi:hypothetical protein